MKAMNWFLIVEDFQKGGNGLIQVNTQTHQKLQKLLDRVRQRDDAYPRPVRLGDVLRILMKNPSYSYASLAFLMGGMQMGILFFAVPGFSNPSITDWILMTTFWILLSIFFLLLFPLRNAKKISRVFSKGVIVDARVLKILDREMDHSTDPEDDGSWEAKVLAEIDHPNGTFDQEIRIRGKWVKGIEAGGSFELICDPEQPRVEWLVDLTTEA